MLVVGLVGQRATVDPATEAGCLPDSSFEHGVCNYVTYRPSCFGVDLRRRIYRGIMIVEEVDEKY